jgi:integrase
MTGSIATKVNAKGQTRFYAVISTGVDPDTRRRTRAWYGPFETEEEAHKKRHELERDREEQTFVAPAKKVTVTSFFREWIDGARLRPSTVESYRRNIESHVLPDLGKLKLQSLTAGHLNALYRKLEKSGRQDESHRGEALSPRTVRYVHTIIRRALKDAVRQQLVVVNVALNADPPTAKMASEAAPEMRTWTAEELGRFLTFTQDDRYGPAWLFLATTGMRRGEALGLRWTDLKLDASPATATVRRAAIAISHQREAGKTKTGKDRLIELDAFTVDILKGWKARQAAERLLVGPGYQSDELLVFTLPDGRGYHPERFSREFERKQASYNRLHPTTRLPRLRLHDTRHTWATLALAAGVHPKVVQERLGHTSIATTMNVYSHALPGMQSQAAEQVSAMIFGRA